MADNSARDIVFVASL